MRPISRVCPTRRRGGHESSADGPVKWIVIGAGSAGSVVARRLVDAGHDVVLIEAGPRLRPGEVPSAIDGPDSFAALASPGRIHTDLLARRTPSGAPSNYLRGRGEGGSSAVNSMVALRGDDRLYASWGWHDAEEHFDHVLVPVEPVDRGEVGRVGRLLLDADEIGEVARLTRRDGRRVTAAEAYVWPVLSALTTVSDACVDRVETDAAGAAVGVRLADGTRIDGDAVAVCAGAIHTPAILQRSGLDGAHVGAGLCDHPAAALTLRLRDPSGACGLSVSALADHDPVQLLSIDHLGVAAEPDLAVLLVALMRPTSASGAVRITTDDPHAHPRVDFDLLSDDADVGRLSAGVESALELLASPSFTTAVDEVFIDDVGTPVAALEGRDAISTWVRRRSADYVHASSSMAKALADHGRVRGHERLFVADASAFPAIPNVNTNLPTMMLAERFVRQWIDTET